MNIDPQAVKVHVTNADELRSDYSSGRMLYVAHRVLEKELQSDFDDMTAHDYELHTFVPIAEPEPTNIYAERQYLLVWEKESVQ